MTERLLEFDDFKIAVAKDYVCRAKRLMLTETQVHVLRFYATHKKENHIIVSGEFFELCGVERHIYKKMLPFISDQCMNVARLHYVCGSAEDPDVGVAARKVFRMVQNAEREFRHRAIFYHLAALPKKKIHCPFVLRQFVKHCFSDRSAIAHYIAQTGKSSLFLLISLIRLQMSDRVHYQKRNELFKINLSKNDEWEHLKGWVLLYDILQLCKKRAIKLFDAKFSTAQAERGIKRSKTRVVLNSQRKMGEFFLTTLSGVRHKIDLLVEQCETNSKICKFIGITFYHIMRDSPRRSTPREVPLTYSDTDDA